MTDAQFPVTLDNDLLDLMDAGSGEGRRFRHRFPGLTILRPADFLRALAGGAP